MLGRINWRPTIRDIRYFVVTFLLAAVVFSLVLLLLGKPHAAGWLGSVGVLLSLFSYFLPGVGKWVYLFWMTLTFLLGRVVSPIVTALIFYLIVTPIGLILRVIGKDHLRLKKPAKASSYFHDYSDASDPESFRRQF